jgi:hypothetical protein
MSADQPSKGQPRLVTPASDVNGPTYEYRGAAIYSNTEGTNFAVTLNRHDRAPQGTWGGVPTLSGAQAMIDAWLDKDEAPPTDCSG